MVTKRFEDMTPEEKRDAFERWTDIRSKAQDDPAGFLLESIEETLKPYIPDTHLEEAIEELKDTLESCFTTLEEIKAE